MSNPRSWRRNAGDAARIIAVLVAVALGGGTARAAAPSFDPRDNRLQYASEYRDPAWGGVYLRARWYAPELPTFVSRDPVHQINRYGYGGGNAVMNVDPTGRSFRSFSRGVSGVLNTVESGIGGHFARFFLAPLIGPAQILANPKGFWHGIRHNTADMDIFLAAGVAVEAAAPFAFPLASSAVRFGLRVGSEFALGAGQSVTSAAEHGFHHFDSGTLIQGLEYTVGPLAVGRVVAGLGYQPFNLDAGHIDKLWLRAFRGSEEPLPSDTALYFRVRAVNRLNQTVGWTSPLQEWTNTGAFHERLLAVTKDAVYFSDATGSGTVSTARWDLSTFITQRPLEKDFRFNYVGRGEMAPEMFQTSRTTERTRSAWRTFVSGGETLSHTHTNRMLELLGVKP